MFKIGEHSGRNYAIGVIVVFCIIFGIIGILVMTGTTNNPFSDNDDNGYGGSGISEGDWFDGFDLDWTEYTNPDDPTGYPIVYMPNDNFSEEGSTYYNDLNYSNVTDFGGFILEQIVTGVNDEVDSARAMIIIYANLDETAADEDDLFNLIDAALEIGGEFTIHADSPRNMTVDNHGEHSVTIREGEDVAEGMYAMLCYVHWDCEQTDRTYTMMYGVAKNLTFEGNEWSDQAFYTEVEYAFEHVVCHT